MYITCQECDTIFRLDDRLLKPTGSKVRCSQCGNTFVAVPPSMQTSELVAEQTPGAVPEAAGATAAASLDDAGEDRELGDIDLAELDSILEQDTIAQDVSAADQQDLAASEVESVDAEIEIDDSDLEIDFDAALESGADVDVETEEAVQSPASEGDLDDIDLDMDFEIEDWEDSEDTAVPSGDVQGGEDIVAPEKAGMVADDVAQEDFELSMDDLDLESDQGDAGAPEMAETEDNLKEGLDLDFELDDEPAMALGDSTQEEAADQSDLPIEETPDLDLDAALDMDGDLEEALEKEDVSEAISDQADDELDLSDLDAMLDGVDEKTDEGDLVLDDLGIEPETDTEAASQPDSEETEDGLEALDFELDAEFEDKPTAQEEAARADAPTDAEPELELSAESDASSETAPEQEDEIDLSDIEQMLEGDTIVAQIGDDGALDLDLDDAGEKWSADQGGDLDIGSDGEIDLSEIEAAIDDDEETQESSTSDLVGEDEELELSFNSDTGEPVDTVATDVSKLKGDTDELELDLELDGETQDSASDDLELDFELESDDQQAPSSEKESEDLEFDLSDLSDLVEEKEQATGADTVDGGDIELEFQVEEEETVISELEPENAKETLPDNISVEETIAALPLEEEAEIEEKPVKEKKGASKSLVVVLILVLLGGGGYFGYDYITKNNIQIPYLSDYLNPKPMDTTGAVNLSTLEINSKFIENTQAGRLFVITGKVHNGYDTIRGGIRLQGKLFAKGKKLVKTEVVYAGVMVTDQELAQLPVADIKKRLSTMPQPQDAAAKVRPNQSLPFVVVFSELPSADDLDEFAIELVGSTQAQ